MLSFPDAADCCKCVLQEDGLKQVYDIFTADPVDPGVKKSAADQLAIMLQGPLLMLVWMLF